MVDGCGVVTSTLVDRLQVQVEEFVKTTVQIERSFDRLGHVSDIDSDRERLESEGCSWYP